MNNVEATSTNFEQQKRLQNCVEDDQSLKIQNLWALSHLRFLEINVK